MYFTIKLIGNMTWQYYLGNITNIIELKFSKMYSNLLTWQVCCL